MKVPENVEKQIVDLFFKENISPKAILMIVAPNGELIIDDVYKILNEYQESNNIKYTNKSNKVDAIKEEVFELREQKYSYAAITKHFRNKGITVYETMIMSICKEIYKEKGMEEPCIGRHEDFEYLYPEIFMLRELRLSYEIIAEYFKKQNIKITTATVSKLCKQIYNEKGIEEPRLKKCRQQYKNIEDVDETIFNLREQGLSYGLIAIEFEKQGVSISIPSITERCKFIYQKKGMQEPETQIRKKKLMGLEPLLIGLKKQQFSYKDVTEYLKKQGINISKTTIGEKYRKMSGCSENSSSINEEYPDKEILIRLLLNLKNTKNATNAQINELSKIYGINLDLEETREL